MTRRYEFLNAGPAEYGDKLEELGHPFAFILDCQTCIMFSYGLLVCQVFFVASGQALQSKV